MTTRYSVVEQPKARLGKYDDIVEALRALPAGKAIRVECQTADARRLVGLGIRQRLKASHKVGTQKDGTCLIVWLVRRELPVVETPT